MSIKNRFLEIAKDSIDNFGMSVAVKQKINEQYYPDTGEVSSTENVYIVKALVEDYNEKFIDRKLIKTGDKKVTLATSGLNFEPEIGDEITINTSIYNVVNKREERFQDAGIIFILQIRK